VLPVTSEQLWKALPAAGGARAAGDDPRGRPLSVHLADFPREDELKAYLAPALVQDWDRLLSIRNVVNAEIERQRKEKVVGNSLGARVTIRAAGADYELLRRYQADLPMLFIVSDVGIDRASGHDEALAVEVEAAKATGVKCARCWRFVVTVSDESGREGLCDRCIGAIAETVRT